MQDVWIVPARAQRSEEHGPLLSGANNRYGSTVRWFDHAERRWKIVWINPVPARRAVAVPPAEALRYE